MRNYIILNGNNSNTISGLLIQSLPPISKPLMRTAIEEIDGRDGDIVTNLGYSAYDKEVSIGLYGTYDVDEVIKYFSDNSKGQVTFSNEPDKYYNYEIINQIDFERLIRFKTAIVTLHCQPFKYPTEETPVEIEIQNINNEAEEMDLDNTADAPMKLDLKGNTQQDSTAGKNLFTIKNYSKSGWNITIDNPLKGLSIGDYTISCLNKYITADKGIAIVFSNGTGGNVGYFVGYDFGNTLMNKTTNITQEMINANYLVFMPQDSLCTQEVLENMKIMIENGSTATDYEPYTNGASPNPDYPQEIHNVSGDNTIEICGKNLISSYTKNEGNQIYFNGVPDYANNFIFKPGTYTFSYINNGSNNILTYIKEKGGASSTNKGSGNPITFTTTKEFNIWLYRNGLQENEVSQPQLEKGSTATEYEPYTGNSQLISLGNIELNKISTYQDYIYKDNDRWFLHKEIGKVILDGSEEWVLENNGRLRLNENYFNDRKLFDTSNEGLLCDYFKVASSGDYYVRWRGANEYYINFYDKDISTANDFKTWLSTHNTEVYYVLATPTDTEITDTTLLEQLNNLEQAKSYDGTTHITQNANDKPFILNATAVQKGTDTATVDNDGNIYSKPTLDIEGNGIVAIYLNGNQIFSVDLSNSSECIIDVTNLEAYDPETNELMNRQVTGDYSKFILPVGENQVKVSGNVTKTTISDYVRWL